MRRRVALVGWVFLAGLCCQPAGRVSVTEDVSEQWPATEKAPGPLPADLVAAWQKAGAQPRTFRLEDRRAGAPGPEWEWPGFRFRRWQAGVLAKLPKPEHPFGLDLSATPVTDAELKALSRMTHLRWLSLSHTRVTDEGLRELTNLKQLRTLDLIDTRVTEAGVAELKQALPRCAISG